MAADIIIFKRRDRAYVVGNTPKGVRWIKRNIVNPLDSASYAMDSGLVEDVIKDFEEAELIVEVQ